MTSTPVVETTGAITPYDAAVIATNLTVEQIETIVGHLSKAEVPLLLRRLDQATTLINTAKKVATIRMLEEDRLGEEWTSPEGEHYRFEQSRRGEFNDIPGLFYYLSSVGASITELARAVSGLRVTDMEAVIATLPADVREDARHTLAQHREYREGTARLEAVTNPYRRKR